jgi:TolB protein
MPYRFAPPRAVGTTLALLFAFLLAPNVGQGQDTTSQRGVRIGLSYALGAKPGVYVAPVSGANGDSVRAILQRDLDFGDRVTLIGIDSAGIALAPLLGGGRPSYDVFTRLGAAALVVPVISPTGVRIILHDVGAKKVVETRDFPLSGDPSSRQWRASMHAASDAVEEWVTGVRGIAATRIAFVRGGHIYIVDSDGAVESLASQISPVLSPAWSPDGQHIAYSELANTGSRIGVIDVASGAHRTLVARAGLNITPEFSPDGSTIIFSSGADDGTDLWTIPATGGALHRVTVGRGTDNVSPSFSPDGRRVAFTSGRSGHPEVYIMDADGTGAELLTPFAFGDQYYRSNPDWSPDGRNVAFQSQIAGQFQIMTISLRDRGVKQHTSESTNEDPSWAPDGRHIVFTSSRTGVKQLWVLDTESGRVRQLTRSGGARLAAWSPRLVTR